MYGVLYVHPSLMNTPRFGRGSGRGGGLMGGAVMSIVNNDWPQITANAATLAGGNQDFWNWLKWAYPTVPATTKTAKSLAAQYQADLDAHRWLNGMQRTAFGQAVTDAASKVRPIWQADFQAWVTSKYPYPGALVSSADLVSQYGALWPLRLVGSGSTTTTPSPASQPPATTATGPAPSASASPLSTPTMTPAQIAAAALASQQAAQAAHDPTYGAFTPTPSASLPAPTTPTPDPAPAVYNYQASGGSNLYTPQDMADGRGPTPPAVTYMLLDQAIAQALAIVTNPGVMRGWIAWKYPAANAGQTTFVQSAQWLIDQFKADLASGAYAPAYAKPAPTTNSTPPATNTTTPTVTLPTTNTTPGSSLVNSSDSSGSPATPSTGPAPSAGPDEQTQGSQLLFLAAAAAGLFLVMRKR